MKKCHFIGIGGIGMSGLARLLIKKNISVSGSDQKKTRLTEALVSEGACVYYGHQESHIKPDTTVIYTSGITLDTHVEIEAARKYQCPIMHRSQLLYHLMQDHQSIVITGMHGKTMTSALLASVLMHAGVDPSWAIGGILRQYHLNAYLGKGNFFVAEGDESDGTVVHYHPDAAIITNLDLEHLDHYKDEKAIEETFKKFASQVKRPEFLLWCGDDFRLKNLHLAGVSYGRSEGCQFRLRSCRQEGWKLILDFTFEGKEYKEIEVPLCGEHQSLNALAVFGLALLLGIDEETIREGLRSFQGVARRCEIKKEEQGVLVMDDYAHHPTEIAATLKGIRKAIENRRLIAVFQPHRFTRTAHLLNEFASCFENADQIYVTDIYPAGESPILNIHAERLVQEIKKNTDVLVAYLQRDVFKIELQKQLRPHDVLVTLGAGDITNFADDLFDCRINKYRLGLIYGGKSPENEFSHLSSAFVVKYLNREYYDVVPFVVSKEGHWTIHEKEAFHEVMPPEVLSRLSQCEVLFPVVHGPNGEDGTMQGFFEILGIPYVGADHRSAAVAMDKVLTKRIIMTQGIRTAPFIEVKPYEWEEKRDQVKEAIAETLIFPIFAKVAHLGSSIGVYQVSNIDALDETLQKIFKLDDLAILENTIKGRELEFSVIGNDELKVFPPGEILSKEQIYDYEKKKGKMPIAMEVRADVSPSVLKEGMRLAEKAYRSIGCCGYARVDFFLDSDDQLWFNEINPIPGMTELSLFHPMCKMGGLDYPELLDRLIRLGLEKQRKKKKQLCASIF